MRYTVWAVALTCIGILPLVARAQCSSIDRGSPVAVAQEVNRIYNKTLDGMTYALPSGVKATTWSPPADSVRDQIKCLGAVAVPAIVELLHNGHRSFGSYLAIQMLGWAGGSEIVPPLAEVLSRPDASQVGLKTYALEALASAPPDDALPIVEKFLRSEKDAHLLDQASGVEARLKSSGKD